MRSALVFRTRPSARFLPAGVLAALLLGLSCLGAKQSRIVPPEAQPPVRVEGNRVAVQVKGVEIALELLDSPARLRFLRQRQVVDVADPFAPDPRGRYRFTTFRLDLINRSAHEVNLHPSSLQAYADVIPQFPMEYTAYYQHFVSRLRLDPAVLERLERAAVMNNIVVPPGGRMSALLAFQDLPQQFKRFRVSCSSILVGAESHTFTVPFDVVQEKVKKR